MIAGKIIGVLPLMNIVLVTNIVVVMVVDSLAHFQVKESEATVQATQVGNFNVVLTQEVQDFGCLGVVEFQDLGTGQFGVVATVGDRPGVVVRVEFVEQHSYWICYDIDYQQIKIYFHLYYHQVKRSVKILYCLCKVFSPLILIIPNLQSKTQQPSTMTDRNTIRLRVKTNKFLDMIVAIEVDKSVRELAHRVLHCFHELADQHASVPPKRRDLTVSALKMGGYFVSKTEIVGSLLKDYDEIQCVLSKAKPKFPNVPKAYNNKPKQNGNNYTFNFPVGEKKSSQMIEQYRNEYQVIKDKKKSKKQMKKDKKKQKQLEEFVRNCNRFQDHAELSQAFGSPPKQKKKMLEEQEEQINDEDYIIYKKEKHNQSPQISQFENVPHNEEKESMQNQLVAEVNPPETETKQDKNNQSISFQAKKDDSIAVSNPSPGEDGKKRKTGSSILQILSKATEEKQKKAKKKEKKNLKTDQSPAENKGIQPSNQPEANIPPKSLKIDKQPIPNNKIASPKVTFHNSPLLSPQVMSLNSPKRKISNPAVQKLQLESLFPDTTSTKPRKENQKEKKTIQSPRQPPQPSKKQKQKQKYPTTAPKIIVEQDSEESGQVSTKAKQEQKCGQSSANSKLAALNAKISKYKLQFFNDSDENND